MARVRYTKNSFAVGVISQKVKANTDFEQYNNALEECVNFQVQQTGGLFKRGGSIFVAETKEGYARLILYVYDSDNQYICEFGEHYIRFFTKYGAIEQDGYGAVTDANDDIVEVVTTFSEETVRTMHTFQDGNSLMMVTDQGLYELDRTSSSSFALTGPIPWTCEPLTFLNKADILLKPDNTVATELSPCTIIAVRNDPLYPPPLAQYAPVFHPADIGHELCLIYKVPNSVTGVEEEQRYYLRILTVTPDERDNRFNKITAYIESEKSPNNATSLPNDTPVRKWQIGAFNSTRGQPTAATVFEGRLFLGNNLTYPTGIWGSAKLYGDFTDYFLGANDADAVQFKITGKHSDSILWMIGQAKLFIGTSWGIYIGGSATWNDEAITPSNFRCRLFDSTGASPLQPIEALDSVFFVDASGKNVHEIVLSGETGAYESHDVSILANDLTQSGIIAHTWQQNPVKTYWCAVNDGFLCSLTYLKENGIMAWSKHVISGDNVKVEDLQCMHGDKNDLLWMIVRREVDGEFKRYIEYIHPPFNPLDQEEFKQHYVDCSSSKEIKFKITNIVTSSYALYRLNKPVDGGPKDISIYNKKLNAFYFYTNSNLRTSLAFLGACGTVEGIGEIALLSRYNRYAHAIEDSSVVPFNTIDVSSFNGLTSAYNIAMSIAGELDTKNVVGTIRGGQTYLKIATERLSDSDTIILVPADNNLDLSTRPTEWDEIWYKKYSVKISGENNVFCYDDHNQRIDFPIVNKSYKFLMFKDYDIKISSTISRARPSTIEIEGFEGFPDDSGGSGSNTRYSQIYVNKVSGTTQINQQTLLVKKSTDLNGLMICTPTTFVGRTSNRHTVTLMHTYEWSPYDEVNPTGNVYLYFDTISVPHLANKQVKICADGNDHTTGKTYTVPASGTIDLTKACDGAKMYVTVGLPIKSSLLTTSLSLGSLLGSGVGTVGGQKCCFLYLYYSLGGKYGTEPDNIYPIPYQNFIAKLDKPKSLVSGLIKCPLVNSKDVYNRAIYVEHDEATSFNILSITQDVEVSDA